MTAEVSVEGRQFALGRDSHMQEHRPIRDGRSLVAEEC